jgi:Na+-translocating ferredoxin:NAD+ oxidoreductase RnfC subunit
MTNKELEKLVQDKLTDTFVNLQHKYGETEPFYLIIINALSDMIGYSAACLIEHEYVKIDEAIEMLQGDIKTTIEQWCLAFKDIKINELQKQIDELMH